MLAALPTACGRALPLLVARSGSWPGSKADLATGSGVRDAYGDRWSQARLPPLAHPTSHAPTHAPRPPDAHRAQLTFLIYLDDDYDGGETTFLVDAEGYPAMPRGGLIEGGPRSRVEKRRTHRARDERRREPAPAPSSLPKDACLFSVTRPSRPDAPQLRGVRVSKGSVLCFFHGDHAATAGGRLWTAVDGLRGKAQASEVAP